MISPKDLHTIAVKLLNRHGTVALSFADHAVNELEALGECERADAWRALKSVLADVVAGRLSDRGLTIH